MNSKNIFLEALEANPFLKKRNNNNNNNNLGANFAVFKIENASEDAYKTLSNLLSLV